MTINKETFTTPAIVAGVSTYNTWENGKDTGAIGGCKIDVLFDGLEFSPYVDRRGGSSTQTPHTHLYLVFSGGVRFSKIKKYFPTAHIGTAHGTSQ